MAGYLVFTDTHAANREYSVSTITTKRGNKEVGEIKFNVIWRRFTFRITNPEIVLDERCLRDIADKISFMTESRVVEWNERIKVKRKA